MPHVNPFDLPSTAAATPVVKAANTLTSKWCACLGDEDYVVSGAGVWPLLALLASAADEPGRTELSAALGTPADTAQRDGIDLLEILRSGTSTTAALGIWTRRDVPLRDAWSGPLPAGVVGELTDQAALDRWAADQTGGLIDHFPLQVTDATAALLASALTARTRWREPFEDSRGGWEVDLSRRPWLSRTTSDPAAVAVLDGAVTRVVVEGDGDLDVHLLLGDDRPADVLTAGLRELAGEAEVRTAADLVGTVAPGMTVHHEESVQPYDRIHVGLPPFEIRTSHDLLAHRDLFGLRAVTNPDGSHLPLMSPAPLFVSEGAQDVVATFSAEGFEAAAVTAFGVACSGALPEDRFRITAVDVAFDRPFGFLAVHRRSRLAVVAGWVNSPFVPIPS